MPSPRTITPGRCVACGIALDDQPAADAEGQIDVTVGREFPPQHLVASVCGACGLEGFERWLKTGMRYLKWEQRFWSKVARVVGVDEREHWHWMRSESTRGPAGGIAHPHVPMLTESGTKRTTTVQRVVWEMFNGPIEEGMFVVRTCDDPICIHPDHLALATRSNAMATWREPARSVAP